MCLLLKGKGNSLKKELKKLNIDKERKLFLAYVNKIEDKVVVEYNGSTVFEGCSSDYIEFKDSNLKSNDIVVQMNWGLRRMGV